MTGLQLQRKIQTAGMWFVGAFMGEFILKYPDYSVDTASKTNFIRYFHEEYGKNLGYSFESTKTKCYALMAIIEAGKVPDALEAVIESNDLRVPEDAKENANYTITALLTGKLVLPK